MAVVEIPVLFSVELGDLVSQLCRYVIRRFSADIHIHNCCFAALRNLLSDYLLKPVNRFAFSLLILILFILSAYRCSL